HNLLGGDLDTADALAVGKAQGRLAIAEAKLKRLESTLGGIEPDKEPPNGIMGAMQNVQAEIRRRIRDGSLLNEEFQPILQELLEHRQAYMGKVTAVLVRMHELNKQLHHIQHSTANAVLQYTGKEERYGLTGPESISE